MNLTTIGNPPEFPHSLWGIASFALAILISLAACAIIGIAAMLGVSATEDVSETHAVVVGMLCLSIPFASLVALALGIVGVIERNRKRAFAVLGIVFNAPIILLSCAFIGLALIAE